MGIAEFMNANILKAKLKQMAFLAQKNSGLCFITYLLNTSYTNEMTTMFTMEKSE